MSTTDELPARLEWVDDWLVLVCGPWRFSVADIEVYSTGTARAQVAGITGAVINAAG